jgi:hypothetical protein
LLARVIAVPLILLTASPALAQRASAQIPEPGDAALFIVAVVGLIRLRILVHQVAYTL